MNSTKDTVIVVVVGVLFVLIVVVAALHKASTTRQMTPYDDNWECKTWVRK